MFKIEDFPSICVVLSNSSIESWVFLLIFKKFRINDVHHRSFDVRTRDFEFDASRQSIIHWRNDSMPVCWRKSWYQNWCCDDYWKLHYDRVIRRNYCCVYATILEEKWKIIKHSLYIIKNIQEKNIIFQDRSQWLSGSVRGRFW